MGQNTFSGGQMATADGPNPLLLSRVYDFRDIKCSQSHYPHKLDDMESILSVLYVTIT